MKVRFGIFTDMHVEFMHDSVLRMEAFLDECRQQGVDFCIQLGDFCQVQKSDSPAQKRILSMLSQQPFPFCHVLGNHDMDHGTKEEVLALLGQQRAFGSFDRGGIHFVYLDANWFYNGTYQPYRHGNYKHIPDSAQVSVLPPEQLQWLKEDLQKAQFPAILFSHQSLIESRSSIGNGEEFRTVLREAPNGVLLCVCGHEHVDRLEEKAGVLYYCLNSMSYYWAGSHFDHGTYGDAIESQYPYLRCVFPYRDALFALIDIEDDRIAITGRTSDIVGTAPAELNFTKPGLRDSITASITDRCIPLKKNP